MADTVHSPVSWPLRLADTLLAAAGHDRRRWLTKPLLMPVLMVAAIARRNVRSPLAGWAMRLCSAPVRPLSPPGW